MWTVKKSLQSDGRFSKRDADRRDDREFDHRGDRRDYCDDNRYPPLRERNYKQKRPSYTPPPPSYRDRRGGYSSSPSHPYRDGRGWHSPSSPPPYWDRRGWHSPSSPPPYWDRRDGYSSFRPLRRSPPFPPYKRSRRDDYQGRRGRGYGPVYRRYDYDYRETGGRLGYHVERPHDMVTGRDGFANAVGAGSNQSGSKLFWLILLVLSVDQEFESKEKCALEGLKSYKQFIQELEDDILPAAAESRYQEYKSGYIEACKRAYFDAHKDEEWLKDKYHPTNLISVIERRNELARKLTKTFILDMQSGILDIGPRITPASANKPGQSSEPNSDEVADDDGKRRWHDRGPTKDTDLLSAAPKVHQVSSEP
ncbi:hypothetical protein HAX54_025688 [Datura stramonium]|uniref:SERRATE/Ars2 N-terminal domain-containing protein n=1 Tax=Datura stramonium TaxID=4076 RepID=A0ABS8V130_DATST|nr:hypothetical protein [Datura stramonium]